MKTPLLALTVLASFALPIFAQEPNAPDPKLREQFLALAKKLDDAFINGDAAAMAAFYTEDAVMVRDDGPPIYGREAILKHWADVFKKVHFSKHVSTLEQYSPHNIGTAGNEVWSTGEFDQTFQVENGSPLRITGHFFDIDVREGDALKFQAETWNFTGPPVPAETK